LAAVSAPLVYVLDKSCQLGLRVIGIKASARRVTEDEIRMLIAEAETAGVVEPEEKAMISSVMRLGDRPVRAVMTPRPDVEWIDIGEDREDILRKIRKTPHTRLLIGRGTVEDVAGVVHVKDLLNAYLDGGRPNIGDCVKAAPAIPDTADILEALDLLKASPLRLALVVDEYGTFEGIVTPNDILEAIVGAFPLAAPGHADEAVRRADGSWLVDGSMPIDRFSEQFGIAVPGDADYHTLAGFVLTALRRVPRTTDAFDWAGWRFEVVDMDGRRVDRLLISPAPGGNSAATEPRES
jgi:putative hemolysin